MKRKLHPAQVALLLADMHAYFPNNGSRQQMSGREVWIRKDFKPHETRITLIMPHVASRARLAPAQSSHPPEGIPMDQLNWKNKRWSSLTMAMIDNLINDRMQ